VLWLLLLRLVVEPKDLVPQKNLDAPPESHAPSQRQQSVPVGVGNMVGHQDGRPHRIRHVGISREAEGRVGQEQRKGFQITGGPDLVDEPAVRRHRKRADHHVQEDHDGPESQRDPGCRGAQSQIHDPMGEAIVVAAVAAADMVVVVVVVASKEVRVEASLRRGGRSREVRR